MKCIKITRPEHKKLRETLKGLGVTREDGLVKITSWFLSWLTDPRNRATWIRVPPQCPKGQVSVTDAIHSIMRAIAKSHNKPIQCVFETACATYRRHHQ